MPVAASLMMLLALAAASPADLAAKGHEAFVQGLQHLDDPESAARSFRQAAQAYVELEKRGARNADMYHNQGNARLLAGDLPGAIFAYRRGLGLAPADRGLRTCLAYARSRVVYPVTGSFARPPSLVRRPWLPWLPLQYLAGLAILLYAGGCALLTRWRIAPGPASLKPAIGVLVLALLLGADAGWQEYEAYQERCHPLVVVKQDGVLLRKGNGRSYPPRYETPLRPGVEARLLFVRGDWLQIQLTGGEVGWVPRSAALVDTP